MIKTKQKQYLSLLSFITRILDIFAIVAGAYLAFYSRFLTFTLPLQYTIAILICTLLVIFGLEYSRVYISWRGKEPLLQFKPILFIWLTVMMILVITAFLTKTSELFSRQWFLTWLVTSLLMLFLMRAILSVAVLRAMKKGWNQKSFVIYGSGDLVTEIRQTVEDSVWTGLRLVGVFDDNQSVDQMTQGGLRELLDIIQNEPISEVWIALPLREEDRVKTVLDALSDSTVTIRYVPDLMGFRMLNHSIMEIAGIPIVNLSDSPIHGINGIVKIMEDKLLASLILILIFPVMLVIAIMIKVTSKGPVFFVQKRTGWDGEPINIYKFRTMIVHKEKHLSQASKDDPRVTRFGSFLRKTSLDELPQFINVLQGRMSIVGPRPHPIEQNDMYKSVVRDYMKRHNVKPGITGWAQINGYRGETDTLEKIRKRIEYDFYYIENWSLWLDFKIIFLTLVYGFVNKNAY